MEKSHLAFLHTLTATTARAVLPLWGCGDKEKSDGVCVNGLRRGLSDAPFQARVVIGEGEKDNAPALYRGEIVGNKQAPLLYDMAVDPLECTSFFANGLGNSLVVVALTPHNSMMDCGQSYYMDKIALPPRAKNNIDKKMLQGDIDYDKFLPHLAHVLGKKPADLVIYMLDKDRHKKIKQAVIKHDARMIAIPAGDIAGAVLAMTGTPTTATQGNHGSVMVDALLGIGGSPEGVVSAAMAKILGAEFLGRFAPQSDKERDLLKKENYNFAQWYNADDFITSGDVNNMAVVLTGITEGMVVPGLTAKKASSLIITNGAATITDYIF
ncbi:MAG: fructose-bisphosphatase class II [Hydrotalea sp.]|nr:fructose-bisphosphatase class II [Hydrotalea sp.]